MASSGGSWRAGGRRPRSDTGEAAGSASAPKAKAGKTEKVEHEATEDEQPSGKGKGKYRKGKKETVEQKVDSLNSAMQTISKATLQNLQVSRALQGSAWTTYLVPSSVAWVEAGME